jgi:hypothetical protein
MSDKFHGFRDAIHVPYVMVKCNTELQPGDKLSLRDNDEDSRRLTVVKWGGKPEGNPYPHEDHDTEPMWHGVADPFLETTIPADAVFRCMIRPECFSKLRHDFTIEVHDRGGTATCHSVCDIF